jgi:hypothetical protein
VNATPLSIPSMAQLEKQMSSKTERKAIFFMA